MHIKVHTSHRHFIAAPMAMGILLVSSFGGALTASLAGPEIDQLTSSKYHPLPSHTQVLPLEGSSFDNGVLEEGSVLVQTEGLAHLQVGSADVHGLNGGFHVVRYGDSISVSALTGPVLYEKDGTHVLIPTGWMWSGDSLQGFNESYDVWLGDRALQSIPERFLKTQMQNLRTFPDGESQLPEISPLPKANSGPSLLFGDAEAREETRWNESVLGALVGFIETKDTVSARVLLDDAEYAAAFTSPRGQEVLTILLSRIAGESSVDSSILEILSANTQLSLLASVHQKTRASAWTIAHSDEKEVELLRLLRFPFSDVLSDGASDFTVQRWQQSVVAKAKMMKEPIPFIEALVKEMSQLIELHYQHAYPERAQKLASFLELITENYRSLLSSQTKSAVLKLALIDRVAWEEEDKEVEAPEEDVVAEVPVAEFNPVEVEQYAYEHLRDAGAMFTVETTVKGVAPNVAEIQSVLFGGTTQDVTAHFSYNVLTNEISDLVVNNTEYPNAIGIVKFGEWVRGL